jgi:TAG lipase/lysophosphatidylethanolamine acyltransferase
VRTKRILNIVVSSTRTHEVPRLLNYLTAPNVVRLMIKFLFTPAHSIGRMRVVCNYGTIRFRTLARQRSKRQHCAVERIRFVSLCFKLTGAIRWSDASMDNVSPTIRLAELFNVNHFIMSQANPYILPFMSKKLLPQGQGFTNKIRSLVSSEVRHRLYQVHSVYRVD